MVFSTGIGKQQQLVVFDGHFDKYSAQCCLFFQNSGKSLYEKPSSSWGYKWGNCGSGIHAGPNPRKRSDSHRYSGNRAAVFRTDKRYYCRLYSEYIYILVADGKFVMLVDLLLIIINDYSVSHILHCSQL